MSVKVDGKIAEIQRRDQQGNKHETLQPPVAGDAFGEIPEFSDDPEAQEEHENENARYVGNEIENVPGARIGDGFRVAVLRERVLLGFRRLRSVGLLRSESRGQRAATAWDARGRFGFESACGESLAPREDGASARVTSESRGTCERRWTSCDDEENYAFSMAVVRAAAVVTFGNESFVLRPEYEARRAELQVDAMVGSTRHCTSRLSWLLRTLGSRRMRGLEAVVAHGTGGGKSDVHDGGPSLEFVVAVAVEQIGNADGRGGAGGFDGCEGRMIIDDVVGEQDFLAAAATHVESGKVIERAGSGHTGKEPVVGGVPKAVFVCRVASAFGAGAVGTVARGLGSGADVDSWAKSFCREARGSEGKQQCKWNGAQPLDSGPGSSIVVVFSHYGAREYHRRVRVVFYPLRGSFSTKPRSGLLLRYGWFSTQLF